MKELEDKLLEILNKPTLSAEDRAWLSAYLKQNKLEDLRKILKAQFQQDIDNTSSISPDLSKKILDNIHNEINAGQRVNSGARVMWFKRLGIAASFIGLAFVIALLVYKKKPGIPVAQNNLTHHLFKNDVPPASKNATLTLSNGLRVVLNDKPDGKISNQGNTKITKTGGMLSYNAGVQGQDQVAYNTVATTNGEHFEIELPDGSMVWLNAASSIRFPTAFVTAERKVEITGEAYFEVAKNKNKPFIVKTNHAEVQVLGTHFNVMNYEDEPVSKTTLLEGSIKYTTKASSVTLKPGEQSQLYRNGEVKVATGFEAEDVIGWKNGSLHFENMDIQSIMRQLARLYDVEIVYNRKVSDRFYADLPSRSNLSDVLKVLELTGKVAFDIQGKKIIVNP